MATRYFQSLEHTPLNGIVLSARLPQCPIQGVVEIHPDSWPVVCEDIEVFEVEETDVRDEPMHYGCPVSSSAPKSVRGSHVCPTGWQPRSRTLKAIRELGETHKIGQTVHSALRSGPLLSSDTDSCDIAFPTRSTRTDVKDAPESPNLLPSHEAEDVPEISPEPRGLAPNGAKRLGVRFAETELGAKEVDEVKKEKREEVKVKMPPKPTRRSPLATQPDTAVDSRAPQIHRTFHSTAH